MATDSFVGSFYRSRWFVPAGIIVAVLIGYAIGAGRSPRGGVTPSEEISSQREVLFWTCSMHPQIRQPGPGLCPICAMDLIPVYEEGNGRDLGPRSLTLSPTARKLAEIQVAPVERKFVEADVRLVGKVEVDETRLGYITARFPGRIDRLWVNYTGVAVEKGDRMADIYSPELLAAQEELLQAHRAAKSPGGGMWEETLDIVRNKLRLWDLTEEQMDGILERGEPNEHMALAAPMSGIVLHRHATAGMYVKTGMQIYTIADLSHVWVQLQAYETDLPWIQEGQEVEFEAEAYPGETFTGTVAFVDPVVDARTRTVKVRVEVENLGGRLKPEMFVRAAVSAGVSGAGGTMPLVIPASAPLITGRRAVVYVAVPEDEGTYEGRDIVLGSRAGDYYVVREGLAEGEIIVVNGAFKIDSALQILAKPSMMSPEGGVAAPGHHAGPGPSGAGGRIREKYPVHDVPPAFRQQLSEVYSAYFPIQEALSHDSLEPAREAARMLAARVETVDMRLLSGRAHDDLMRETDRSRNGANLIASAADIEEARRALDPLSQSLIRVATHFGPMTEYPIVVYECSMAFEGRGARWLQNKHGVENPYYGSAMFRCGEETEVIHAGRTDQTSPRPDHSHE